MVKRLFANRKDQGFVVYPVCKDVVVLRYTTGTITGRTYIHYIGKDSRTVAREVKVA